MPLTASGCLPASPVALCRHVLNGVSTPLTAGERFHVMDENMIIGLYNGFLCPEGGRVFHLTRASGRKTGPARLYALEHGVHLSTFHGERNLQADNQISTSLGPCGRLVLHKWLMVCKQ